MEFFFSAELDEQVDEAWRRIAKPLETTLNNSLGSCTYGPAVKSIALIPMILRPEWAAGHRERRLWKRSDASIDYRPWVSFAAFRDGTDDTRRALLVRSLLEAIADVQRKAGAAFEGDRLRTEILAALNLSPEDLAGLPRWPD